MNKAKLSLALGLLGLTIIAFSKIDLLVYLYTAYHKDYLPSTFVDEISWQALGTSTIISLGAILLSLKNLKSSNLALRTFSQLGLGAGIANIVLVSASIIF